MSVSNAVLPDELIEELLSYINLSGGAHDPAFARKLNRLCDHLGGVGCWNNVGQLLGDSLESLADTSPALADEAILDQQEGRTKPL